MLEGFDGGGVMGAIYICACCGMSFADGGDLDGEVYSGVPICENCSIDFDDLSVFNLEVAE